MIGMVRENFPSIKLHASTRMNVASARGINLLSRHGFSRTRLPRELSLDGLRDIRLNTNMELEVFVHGSPCVSVSGLCLFSSYLGGKSANRGICTYACKRFYTAHKGKNFEESSEEESGCYFMTEETELIEAVPALIQAGVNSFRIKSRMKNAGYTGTAVYSYRLVMDSLDSGEEKIRQAIETAKRMLKDNLPRRGSSL
jgi:putative protease